MLWWVYQGWGQVKDRTGLHKSCSLLSGVKALTLRSWTRSKTVKMNKSIPWQIDCAAVLIIFHNRWTSNDRVMKRVWDDSLSIQKSQRISCGRKLLQRLRFQTRNNQTLSWCEIWLFYLGKCNLLIFISRCWDLLHSLANKTLSVFEVQRIYFFYLTAPWRPWPLLGVTEWGHWIDAAGRKK